MNRTLRDLSAAPTPGSHEKGERLFHGEPRPSPTGEGAYRWQIGERLLHCYSSLVRYDNQSAELPLFCPLPRGGGLEWGQQAPRAAATLVF